MKSYFVEGVYILRQKGKRKTAAPATAEPFAKTIWASNVEEALQLATLELGGIEWVQGPKVSQSSEEQCMRAMGAPELPGFSELTKPGRSAPRRAPRKSARKPR